MKTLTTLLFLALSISVFAQLGSDKPGYTPIIAKLLGLNHKANSNSTKYEKISTDDLKMDSQAEFINIYVNYEMDMDVPKKNSIGYFTVKTLPAKLMNLDLIYSYRYEIPYTSEGEFNSLLPVIVMGNDFQLESIDAVNFYLEKGKVKNKKINKNQIQSDATSNKLKISFEDVSFKDNSLVEITIEIKSRYFNSINPTFNTAGSFNRKLTFSLPAIFKYSYPSDQSAFKLIDQKEKLFEFLEIRRNSIDWNTCVDLFITDCETLTWEVASDFDPAANTPFELQDLDLPSYIDIGVPRTELYQIYK